MSAEIPGPRDPSSVVGRTLPPRSGESGTQDLHVRLPGGAFALWRWLVLRSAGFPAEMVRGLGAPELLAISQRRRRAEDAEKAARRATIEACSAALAALAPADDGPAASLRRRRLRRVRRDIDRGRRASIDPDLPAALGSALAALEVARAEADGARAALADAYHAARARVLERARAIAREPAFREAVLWESPTALRTGVDPFARAGDKEAPAAPAQRTRQREQMVTQYAQRFCTKNDTIGFFGPTVWARWGARGAATRVEVGATLLDWRGVFFESWGLDALAARLAADRRLRPWLAPRRLAFVDVDGTTLRVPLSSPRPMSAGQAELLRRCDGRRSARELAAALVEEARREFPSEQAVLAVLEAFQTLGLITWRLELPWTLHPERALREGLGRIGDQALRAPGLAALGRLEAARDAVAAAAGDADRLDHAHRVLGETFREVTGREATREGGFYSARSIVYEECRRSVEVELGADLLERLGPPLTLLLTSARWLCHTFHRDGGRALLEAHRDAGGGETELVPLLMRARGLLRPVAEAARRQVERRWAAILAPPADARVVSRRADDLRPAVDAAFAVPRADWEAARHTSVDILVAAAGAESLRAGACTLVVGEVHPAANVLSQSCFNVTHPAREELDRAVALDLSRLAVMPVEPSEGPIAEWVVPSFRVGVCTLVPPQAARLDLAGRPAEGAEGRVIPVGRLRAVEQGGALLARDRQTGLTFPVLDVLGRAFLELCPRLPLLPDAGHVPRLVVDDVVVARETWRCRAADLPTASTVDPVERFHAARVWAESCGMPRFLFVWSPLEAKPAYLDLGGPVFVEILARWGRRALEADPQAALTFTEMVPAHDELWLADHDGRRYTSELRMVAVAPR